MITDSEFIILDMANRNMRVANQTIHECNSWIHHYKNKLEVSESKYSNIKKTFDKNYDIAVRLSDENAQQKEEIARLREEITKLNEMSILANIKVHNLMKKVEVYEMCAKTEDRNKVQAVYESSLKKALKSINMLTESAIEFCLHKMTDSKTSYH